jgi:type II secretory pathway component GspD/PulD (secretin)
LLAEWTTSPPEAGKETRNELSGDSEQVAERLEALRKANKLAVVERFRLMALNGSKAQTSSGTTTPVTQGVSMSSFGVARNVIDRHVGTFLRVVPEVAAPGTIQLDLAFERSKLVTSPDAPVWVAPNQGEKVAARGETTFTAVTVLRVDSGHTAAIAGHSSDGRHQLLLVSANLLP